MLVLDAVEGLREMDATIGGYVQEAGRGIVVVGEQVGPRRDTG